MSEQNKTRLSPKPNHKNTTSLALPKLLNERAKTESKEIIVTAAALNSLKPKLTTFLSRENKNRHTEVIKGVQNETEEQKENSRRL